jgi:ribose transport system permease protein
MSTDGIMAVGMTVLMISGAFDLSIGSTFGLSGALTLGLAPSVGLGGAIVIALTCGAAVGAVNGFFVTKAGINSLIVTLGTMSAIAGVVLIYSNGQSIQGATSSLTHFANGRTFLPNDAWVMVGLAGLVTFVLTKTTIGRYVYAVGGNSEAAELAGIRADRYRIVAFVAMGFVAAMAGVLSAGQLSSVDPTAGSGLELDVIAAVIIGGTSLFGGTGAVWRSLVGVALLTSLTDGFNLLNVNTYYQPVVEGVVIVLSVSLYTRRQRR